MAAPPMGDATIWRQCNICKSPIPYVGEYYLCSVSTCQRKRTGFVFCSMACFDAHLPMMRHRDAWAEPQRAPSREQAERERLAEATAEAPSPASPAESVGVSTPVRRLAPSAGPDPEDDDALVVVSKLKKFIKTKSGMNTSDGVFPVLSQHLRELSVAALRVAASEGRKTVLDRDFSAVLRPKDR